MVLFRRGRRRGRGRRERAEQDGRVFGGRIAAGGAQGAEGGGLMVEVASTEREREGERVSVIGRLFSFLFFSFLLSTAELVGKQGAAGRLQDVAPR